MFSKERNVSAIEQGLTLMLIGMAVVFTFLILLVLVMKVLSAFVQKYFPEKEKPVAAARPAASNKDAEIAAAAAAAASFSRR
ncbi:MAG: OadG family protein [Spirochaetales bacterium]|nr:OadG family protein [Spirochaetales bacterium]